MILILFAFCISVIVSATASPTAVIGWLGGEATVNVRIGEEFLIEAKTIPSTGYDWHLSGPLPTGLEILSTEYIRQASEGVVGAAETLRLRFVAREACSGRVDYVRKRASEATDSSHATMTIFLDARLP